MNRSIYSTAAWKAARERAIERDGGCSVRLLLGGQCRGPLHAHHLVRPEDGGRPYALSNLLVACAAHHPKVEAVRRAILRGRERRRACPHRHATLDARLICEARLVRRELERLAA